MFGRSAAAVSFAVIAMCVLSASPVSAELCTQQVCEYNFTVYGQLGMADAKHLTYLFPNGTLYRKNNTDGNPILLSEEEAATVLVIDGYERMVMTVNGIVPGPTIEVYEGAEVVVHVKNNLINNAVTFHWHGMWQRGTPWMDGVSTITQCGILPSESFTYRFFAEPAGTHAWHAHHGLERPDGLFGALIVHKRPGEEGQRAEMCDVDQDLMVLSEWYHSDAITLYFKRIEADFWPNGYNNPPFEWTRMVDGRMAGEVPWVSGLFNGRGRYRMPDGNMSYANLTVYDVEPSKTYCYRVVATMMEKDFRLWIDGHNITVFASDGFDVEPLTVDHLIIHQGETYDIAVDTYPENVGKNFWVHIKTLEDHSADQTKIDHEGRAIMRYPDAPVADPDSETRNCTEAEPCTVLNCPFAIYPVDRYMNCLPVTALKNANASDVPPDFPRNQFQEHFLNFEFNPLGVNRKRYALTNAPLLTQFEDANPMPCPENCEYTGCNCTHILTLPFNYTVQLVLTNMGSFSFGFHPVHLHGHTFHVLKMAYPPVNPVTGIMNMSDHNHDVTCLAGTECAVANWTDGNMPALNFDRAIRKDTVVVPPGGYVVIRFVTDNPGFWHMHCHMSAHLEYGMGLVLDTAPSKQHLFPPPAGFPRCNNWAANASYVEASHARWSELMSGGVHAEHEAATEHAPALRRRRTGH